MLIYKRKWDWMIYLAYVIDFGYKSFKIELQNLLFDGLKWKGDEGRI